MGKMERSEFEDATQATIDCVGRVLCRKSGDQAYRALIVEVWTHEGYGKHTANREGMAYTAGRIYVMSHRGHNALNIAAGHEGEPSCVWIREVYPLNGLTHNDCKKPFTFTKAMHIDRSLDGEWVNGDEIWIEGERTPTRKIVDMTQERDKPENCVGCYRLHL